MKHCSIVKKSIFDQVCSSRFTYSSQQMFMLKDRILLVHQFAVC